MQVGLIKKFKNFIQLGQETDNRVKQIQVLINKIALLLAVSATPYFFIFRIISSENLANVVFLIVASLVFSVFLNNAGYRKMAGAIIICCANLTILFYSCSLTKESGIQLVYFALAIIPFIIYQNKEVMLQIAGVLVPITFMTFCEITGYTVFSEAPFKPEWFPILYLTIIGVTFGIIVISIKSYSLKVDDSATKLQTSNRRLSKHLTWTKKMLERIRSQKAMEADLEKGRKLQSSTLPQIAPQMRNLTISHAFESAKSLSGDYFDYAPNYATATPIPTAYPQNDEDDADTEPQLIFNQIGIIVADVVGKGVAASLEMFSVKTVFKLVHDQWFTPIELVTRLNTMSTGSRLFSKYVPLIYITLTQLNDNQYQLNAVNAGHEYGVIIKANREVILLDQGGAPAGMDKDEKYVETQHILDEGDAVFLYTDGCTDVKSPKGEVIGFDELLPILHQATRQHPKDIARYVRNRLQDFQGKAPQADDMTIVAVFVGDKA